jgi:hypothetical protein
MKKYVWNDSKTYGSFEPTIIEALHAFKLIFPALSLKLQIKMHSILEEVIIINILVVKDLNLTSQ